ncbi:hypothetical protein CAEBREN_18502 [Caenorhabditis brenneri]|uniref:Uncharacterized protein n=1 Tax=Caenorhabditis brenneri TaxID=135651 RepID=G0NE12_CAEBE|nr:hypothetical protein CAEBREN_18502 [Caenorhabditis brenneri]
MDQSTTRPKTSERVPTIPTPPSTIPITVQSVVLPETITVEDLAKTLVSMATIVQTLQVQNAELIKKIGVLEKEVHELRDQHAKSAPTKKTFADIVSKSFSAPAAQVSLLRAAELAQSVETRKSSVIIRNVDLSSDATNDTEFASKVAKECNVTSTCQVFRIPLKNDVPPLIKLQFNSKEEAEKVLKSFNQVKDKLNGCRNSTARPDLTKPELIKYRQAWKQAIKLNNDAKERIWTVRNLELVRIPYKADQSPWPWTVRENK